MGSERPASLKELLDAFFGPKPASRFSDQRIDIETAEVQWRLLAFVLQLLPLLPALEVVTAAAAEVGWHDQELAARHERQARAIGPFLEYLRKDPFLWNVMLASTLLYGPERQAAARGEIAKLLKRPKPFRRDRKTWRGLYELAQRYNEEPDVLLDRLIADAVERAVVAAEEPRYEKRPDNKWVQRDGKRTPVRPAREYGSGTPEFRSWFERTIRNLVEDWLAAAAVDYEGVKEDPKPAVARDLSPAEQRLRREQARNAAERLQQLEDAERVAVGEAESDDDSDEESRPPIASDAFSNPTTDDPAEVADAYRRIARWWDALSVQERAGALAPEGDREARSRAHKKFPK
jgi:hypothetical protein